jgi:hypothetical protein
MSANPERPGTKSENSPVLEHVEGAHDLLKTLRQRIGEHPELTEAIRKLETALNVLTVKTGGVL